MLNSVLKRIVESCEQRLAEIKEVNSSNIVLYTAVFGGYDKIQDPKIVDLGVDYICFTDDPEIKSSVWKTVFVPLRYRDPRRTAKIFKIFPHLFFPDYEASVWVDGSCVITGSIKEFAEKYCIEAPMTVFAHPRRQCLFREARACLRWGKEAPEIVGRQVCLYRESGYPSENGLIAGTVLVRRHNEKKVVELMEEWWRHIDRFSVRDQISFNFVAWQQKFDIEYFPFSIYDNPYFIWGGHSKFIFFDGNGKRMISPKIVLSLLYNKLRHRKRA